MMKITGINATQKAVAIRVDEFLPDSFFTDAKGRNWLHVNYTHPAPFEVFPAVVDYHGAVYYRMSYNSDEKIVVYAAASGRAWHERFCENPYSVVDEGSTMLNPMNCESDCNEDSLGSHFNM